MRNQRPVAHAREAGAETPVEALGLRLLADLLLDFLPLDAERRIGEHVVEVFAVQAIRRERVPEDDVGDVLPLDEHVRLADGVGLGVQLLPVHDEARLGVVLREMLARDAEHAARAGCRVVEMAEHTGLAEGLVIFGEDEVDHEADDFARGEVLSGRLVRELGELADEFLECRAHLRVAHAVGMQVDVRELLRDEVEEVRLGEPIDLGVEVEALEDVADF